MLVRNLAVCVCVCVCVCIISRTFTESNTTARGSRGKDGHRQRERWTERER